MQASATPKGSAAAQSYVLLPPRRGAHDKDMLRAAYTLEGLCAASSLPFVLN